MSTETSWSISIDFDKLVGITDFIPGISWNFDPPEPLGAILFILFPLALAVFLFPLWYVYTLKESTTRIERTLMESREHRANPLEDEETKSCPTQ
ncbi:hypothetical protein [Thioalkalivibrio sp. HK1]|uniref:hypothetical protein n=1 Tax=Thioalkalivibrio sp. HK1 TaxID=1469245 RepID=UPI00047051B7|nr:hypothetical protein [Thioalkalivibrio sp. HK1]